MNRLSRFKVETKLHIGGIIIQLRSACELEKIFDDRVTRRSLRQFANFLYRGSKGPDIVIDISVVEELPAIEGARDLFISYQYEGINENWRLLKKGDAYIYKSALKGKEQVIFINKGFTGGRAYILRKPGKGMVWGYEDIIYDFLQVLLINYLALRKEGVFIHSVGINEARYGGIVFAGKSGAGKSTLARLWHTDRNALVLNDDRIIVRRHKGRFLIYGCPWHGDFGDYLESHIESAEFNKLFFIRHASKNMVKYISRAEALKLLYPNTFPIFWDKECLVKILTLCQEIVFGVDCLSMGFVNDKQVRGFVRDACKKPALPKKR